MNSIAMAHLIAFGNENDALPDEVMVWLRAGFMRYLSSAAPSLEIALQLSSTGRKTARDQALREAAEVLADGKQISPYVLAGLLEKKIKRFEGGGLLLVKRSTPSNLSVLDQCLLQAFRAGVRMRRCQRDLYRLLTDA